MSTPKKTNTEKISAMSKEVQDYLSTRRGLKVLMMFFSDLSVLDALEQAPALSLTCGQTTVTLGDDPWGYDCMLEMYIEQNGL